MRTTTRNKLFRNLLIGTVGAALIVGAGAFAASAQPTGSPDDDAQLSGQRGKMRGKMRGRHGQRGAFLAKRLGLDEQQAAALKTMREDHRKSVEPLRKEKQQMRQELRALWQAETPERDAILAKMAEIRAIDALLDEARVDFKLNAATLMTPEQRSAFLSRQGRGGRGMKGHHGRRGGKWGKRGGMGMGPCGGTGDCPFPDAPPEPDTAE